MFRPLLDSMWCHALDLSGDALAEPNNANLVSDPHLDTDPFPFECEQFPISHDRYSEDGVFHTPFTVRGHLQPDGNWNGAGFGFAIIRHGRGTLSGTGFVWCSRVTIFDPTSGITVDSHLPVSNNHFDIFREDFGKLRARLHELGLERKAARAQVIYGAAEKKLPPFRRYPGQHVADIVRGAGIFVESEIPAQRCSDEFDFDLQTGKVTGPFQRPL